ncbi:MAG TPA: DUF916 domain-containing protein [Thermomicrobiales bacterium]|nr:DUF916 domain-containing protein [Thermomicrobiales bacterium]
MKHRLRIIVLLIACQLSLILGAAPGAWAQESPAAANATATPGAEQTSPKFALVPVGDYPEGYFDDLQVAPGESISLAVNVINLSSTELSLNAFKANAVNMVNGGFAAASPDEDPTGATNWIDFPATTVDLAPGGQQEISFSVTVPKDAKPGQYISAITVETPDAISLSGSSSLDFKLAYSISVGILVPGDKVTTFELGDPLVSVNNLLTSISVPVTNTGNYLVRPAGKLTLKNAHGDVIMSAPIAMESVYAGNTTDIELPLPDQMTPGDYVLDLSLTDVDSSATNSIENAKITIPSASNPRGISVVTATVAPNAKEIAFANVDVSLKNGGPKIPASDVTLQVIRNGKPLEDFPLATNQVLLNGDNSFSARYIPAKTWESGTYTFKIVVRAVDPNGGQATTLLDQDLDAKIVVP